MINSIFYKYIKRFQEIFLLHETIVAQNLLVIWKIINFAIRGKHKNEK